MPVFCGQAVREELKVGTEVFDVESIEVFYPHLEPIPLKKYSCGDVELILGHDVFHCIRPLNILKPTEKIFHPFTVGLGIEWSTTVDFGSNFDMLQGCYSKRNRFKVSRPKPLLV